MGKVGGTTGQFFRDLIARGVVPENVIRAEVYSGRDLSESFHHKANRIFPLLKKMFQQGVTYTQGGQTRPLVRFCRPGHMKAFLGISRTPEAIAVFKKELMGERTQLPRDQYLAASQLSKIYKRGSGWIVNVLQKMYAQGITYESEGEQHPAVVCCGKGDERIMVALRNTEEAKKILEEHMRIEAEERKQKGRRAISQSRGWDDSIVNTLTANTSLDKADIENLGRGFYNRISMVRRQMQKWNQQGHAFRDVIKWTTKEHKDERKVPWREFEIFQHEVDSLQRIILLAEFCKANGLDFRKEFKIHQGDVRRQRTMEKLFEKYERVGVTYDMLKPFLSSSTMSATKLDPKLLDQVATALPMDSVRKQVWAEWGKKNKEQMPDRIVPAEYVESHFGAYHLENGIYEWMLRVLSKGRELPDGTVEEGPNDWLCWKAFAESGSADFWGEERAARIQRARQGGELEKQEFIHAVAPSTWKILQKHQRFVKTAKAVRRRMAVKDLIRLRREVWLIEKRKSTKPQKKVKSSSSMER